MVLTNKKPANVLVEGVPLTSDEFELSGAFESPSIPFVGADLRLPKILLVESDLGRPNILLVGSAGLLRFANRLLEGVAECACLFRFENRLLVVGVKSAGLEGLSNRFPVEEVAGSAGLFRFENKLFVDGVAAFGSPKIFGFAGV